MGIKDNSILWPMDKMHEVMTLNRLRGHNWLYIVSLTWMFLIRVKELFDLIILERKADGFLLFVKQFSW